MEVEKIVEKLKVILEISNNLKDLTLSIMVEDVIEYLNRINVKGYSESLVRRLVVLRYNSAGSEGLASESYDGISQSFLEDLPTDIKREISSLRAVKF